MKNFIDVDRLGAVSACTAVSSRETKSLGYLLATCCEFVGVGTIAIVSRTAWAIGKILLWSARSRERRHLLGLSDHMMKDIGVSRADAYCEYLKRPWQA